jgi:hypothetical protein
LATTNCVRIGAHPSSRLYQSRVVDSLKAGSDLPAEAIRWVRATVHTPVLMLSQMALSSARWIGKFIPP